jgi:hypothetical protein
MQSAQYLTVTLPFIRLSEHHQRISTPYNDFENVDTIVCTSALSHPIHMSIQTYHTASYRMTQIEAASLNQTNKPLILNQAKLIKLNLMKPGRFIVWIEAML